MEDFKSFLEKVLAPIQGETQTPQAPPAQPDAENGSVAGATPEQELERRYVEVMNALLHDASERGAIHVFTDAVAWKLAIVAHRCGPGAAGDILRKFGHHLAHIASTEQAAQEAREAAKAGRRPH